MTETIKISTWSETPGLRFRHESRFSGQQFREEILEPAYLRARKNGEKLIVDFNETEGYGTSFLEEAFGGLARKYKPSEVIETLDYVSEDPDYISEVQSYIEDEQARQQQ